MRRHDLESYLDENGISVLLISTDYRVLQRNYRQFTRSDKERSLGQCVDRSSRSPRHTLIYFLLQLQHFSIRFLVQTQPHPTSARAYCDMVLSSWMAREMI